MKLRGGGGRKAREVCVVLLSAFSRCSLPPLGDPPASLITRCQGNVDFPASGCVHHDSSSLASERLSSHVPSGEHPPTPVCLRTPPPPSAPLLFFFSPDNTHSLAKDRKAGAAMDDQRHFYLIIFVNKTKNKIEQHD